MNNLKHNNHYLYVENQWSSDRPPKTLIAVDRRVEDYERLLKGVNQQATVILVDPDIDGIEQITQAISDRPTHSLHIVCHGNPGTLFLGKTPINQDNILSYRQSLKKWGVSEILLYACDVAADPSSQFLLLLQQLTHAHIAASQYPIGNAAKGGTWDLETKIGSFVPRTAFSPQALQEYTGILHGFYLDQFGTFGNDYLIGTENPDDILALDGDDTLEGLGNTDLLSGNAGNDVIYGNEGSDIAYGGPDDDAVFGFDGNDILSGDPGNDIVSGNAGNDTLVGGVGNDNIYGGLGEDILFAGSLDDYADEKTISLTPPTGVTETTATGALTFVGFTTSANQLDIEGTFSNLSSPLLTLGEVDPDGNLPSAIRLDWGRSELTDSMVRNLTVIDNGDGSGSFSGSLVLTNAEIPAYLAGDYRINIYTVSNPNGELRGQLSPNDGIRSFQAQLDGSQNGVPSLATGEAILTLNESQTEVDYSIDLEGVNLVADPAQRTEAQDVTKIHLHQGDIGASGPHRLNIFGLPSEDDANLIVDYEQEILTGIWDDTDASLSEQSNPMSTKFVSTSTEELLRNGLYIQVHTNAFPDGEIRGQVLATNNNLLGGDGDDVLVGSYGNDFLDGGLGNDTLAGLNGNDNYLLTSGAGVDLIYFEDGFDLLALSGGLTFDDLNILPGTSEDLTSVASQNNTLIQVAATGELLASLSMVSPTLINADDFVVIT
ncbi:MAG: DUF4347 domain-containing protein [Okeania sp. SIO1H6]|nr:DUF4347 domain-containing protein [Okeania sp. SIO1H6]